MTEAPLQPPTAPRGGADAGAAPDFWLGRRLWIRRVLRAGVTTASPAAALRRSAPSLPLLAALLERHGAAIAHLAGDGGANSSLRAWLPDRADGLSGMPIAMPAGRIEPHHAAADGADHDLAPMVAAPTRSAASGAGHPSATINPSAATGLSSSPPTVAPIIQRRAAATRSSAPLPIVRAIPAPRAEIAALTLPTPHATSPMPVATSSSTAARAAPRSLGVGAPRRSADGVAPTPVAAPPRIGGSGRRLGAPLRAAAAFGREQPAEKAGPAQPVHDVAIPTRAKPPSMRDQRRDDAVIQSLAGPAPGAAPDRMMIRPRESSIPHPRATGVPPASIATSAAQGREWATSPSAARDAVAPASAPLPPPSPAPLPLVRATAANDAVLPLSRHRGTLPLALPATALPALAAIGETDFKAPQRGPAPTMSRAPSPSVPAETSVAPPSTSAAARPARGRMKLGAPEIGQVAERVYQLLVDRLAQERQRRGA